MPVTEIGKSFCCGAMLVGLLSVVLVRAGSSSPQSSDLSKPVLVNTCLITDKFQELVEFYQHILGVSAEISSGNYAEFSSPRGVLAIFSADAQEKYIPGAAKPANNQSAILQFKVGNVDAEYARLKGLVKTWVKPPTNQPWGTRSIYFRDPDGNLVDFYAPMKPQ
jgi:catechol 2,3-dioxygenase-like lactoylglutathione lyase family enzyme